MFFESLDLPNSSSELTRQFNNLKIRDSHFAKLFEQYNDIDQQIGRIQDSANDEGHIYMDGLKKHRSRLTGQLLDMLSKAK